MFSEYLEQQRKSRHLSQQNLADLLNKKYGTKISKSMISRWESGKSDVRMSYVRIIVDFFTGSLIDEDKKRSSGRTSDMPAQDYVQFLEKQEVLVNQFTHGDNNLIGKNSNRQPAGKCKKNISFYKNDADISNEQNLNLVFTSKYRSINYFDVGISAGLPETIDPFETDSVPKIEMSNKLLGKYAHDGDIFVANVNGDSMNNVIPDGSKIVVKKINRIHNLKNGDIVVFKDGGEFAVKRFYYNAVRKQITFNPDSSDNRFIPLTYELDNNDDLEVDIIGVVVLYLRQP